MVVVLLLSRLCEGSVSHTTSAVCCRRCVCDSLLWMMVTCTADRYHTKCTCFGAAVVLRCYACGGSDGGGAAAVAFV